MIGVAILGCGTVGSGVMQLLTQNREAVSRAAGREVRLTHVLDLRSVETPEGVLHLTDFEQLLSQDDVRIVAESIGGAGVAYEFTRRALESGRSVVSSNKELVAERGDELCALAEKMGVFYRFEAAVGGGVPILEPLGSCLAGNRIGRIDGIVNGSTNYLLTRMGEQGVGFPAALAEAKRLGYVEGNPDADVEGWDARRKLAILANAAFGARFADDKKIPTVGISRVTDRDLHCARALGGTIKLIAHAQSDGETWSGWVNPALVGEGSMLYGVRDVYNGILVRGDFVEDVMFYGRGAGSRPTASAIAGDIVEVARHLGERVYCPHWGQAPAFVQPDDAQAWMVRLEAEAADDARAQVAAALPGARIEALDGMLAVLTAPMTPREIAAAIELLGAKGLRAGVPVRAL